MIFKLDLCCRPCYDFDPILQESNAAYILLMEEIKSRPADLSPHHVLLCYSFAYWVILHALFSSAVVFLFFSKSTFSKIYFRNTIRVSTSLDPDQARRSTSGLILVQTDCKGYQQTTLVGK